MWVLLQTTSAPLPPLHAGGYGAALVQAILALLAVSLLAWVVLRGLARGGMLRSSGRVRVLERTPLDPKHALVLVEVDGRQLLLGLGEGSAPALLDELEAPPQTPAAERDGGAPDARQAFSAALARVRLARALDSSREEKNSVS